MKLANLINEAVDPSNWPLGYFEVKDTFEISPGGGWGVKFNKGDILQVAVSKVDQSLQTITRKLNCGLSGFGMNGASNTTVSPSATFTTL